MPLQKQAFDGIEIKRPANCGAFAADCSALVTPTESLFYGKLQ